MSAQITHRDGAQLVSRSELRRILRAAGEGCYCAPDGEVEWDAGECPMHLVETVQVPRHAAEPPLYWGGAECDPDAAAPEPCDCGVSRPDRATAPNGGHTTDCASRRGEAQP